ncbi:MAG: alpha/beta fold hydrolase [Geothrix sp.]|uniref:YqiA/YcfP family alpha/beta fold hydrolase n=1 Tax=Geothrix sp. TaxID=1962974 RepID=UPI0018258C80|nr:YqiA/YcfP family alpha/beta fold hydrolase [Geothrix sp.]NWJ40753.1 alpha/beta fold hydrolase [Geothrix sp.]WIL21241.1 MAG: alpha/beta fold hydrolase [Geothrix sp.]
MTALVYLHGFSSSPGGNKGTFVRRWAQTHGIPFHAPDLNLPTFERLTLTAQVEAVEALLQGLAERPVMVGSSLGGFVATAVAHRGAAIRSMLLLAPAIHFARRRMTSSAWAAYRERGEMEVFHYGADRPLRLGPELLRDLPAWADDADWRMAVPTVILHGRFDEAVPLAESEAYRDRNPGTALHVLEDDHGLLTSAALECLRNELEAAFR